MCLRSESLEFLMGATEEQATEVVKIMRQVAEAIEWIRRKTRVLIATIGSKNGAHIGRVIERCIRDVVRDQTKGKPEMNLEAPIAAYVLAAREIATRTVPGTTEHPHKPMRC